MLAKSKNGSDDLKLAGSENVKNLESKTANSSKGNARLQLVLPPQSVARLNAIKDLTEAASYAEVIRRALRIYEGLLVETETGATVVVRNSNNEEDDLPIPLRHFL